MQTPFTMRLACLLLVLLPTSLLAQPVNLSYYLPNTDYDPSIPTPTEVLGFSVGEQHAEPGQMASYYRALAAASPRVTLREYGRTYEHRPLFLLTITTETNQSRIDEMQAAHRQWVDPEATDVAMEEVPLVVWMGYSVHGNEPSGANAALLVAYYLAAAPEAEVTPLLKQTVVLMDPFINPDGLNRFASWVNSRRGQVLSTDPQNAEQNEPWPRGRTNHYWFDLNRDWLLQQHPESRGRVAAFHAWKPNVVTDHHEMSTDATFFFMPGVPSRNHPLTPERVFELTRELGTYHAAGLDSIGSLYFTEERYDDFYFGKGSTYPDINGAVGILFEQASARSHAQESENGVLTFPFAVRNQVVTSFTTLRGATALREDLLQYQRNFYQDAVQVAAESDVQGYVFGSEADPARTYHMADVLRRHQIQLHRPSDIIRVDEQAFTPEGSFVVPTAQPQARLVQALFEQRTQFEDSLFYDVSAWTFPLAFDLPFATLTNDLPALSEAIDSLPFPRGELIGGKSDYAYLIEPTGYYVHRALYRLLDAGVAVKVATDSLTAGGQNFPAGTLLVSLGMQQEVSVDSVHQLVQRVADQDALRVHSVASGLTGQGIDLGSRNFRRVPKPEVALLVGDQVSSYDAGEVWHLLDQRLEMPLTLLPMDRLKEADLSRYNTLVMADGSYSNIDKPTREALKRWLKEGNTLVALQEAGRWLSKQEIGGVQYQTAPSDSVPPRPYGARDTYRGAQVIGGAIFSATADLTHPVAYGLTNTQIPLFRDDDLMIKRGKNPYVYPVVYDDDPLLAGYISSKKEARLGGTAAVVATKYGPGTIIVFADNPNFRAYWYGTNKLFINSLFYGAVVDR